VISAVLLAAHVGIGINYIWWKLAPVSHARCVADDAARNEGEWFLPVYDRPQVRAAVRAQLRAMRSAGFTTLRVLVFFYRTTDASSTDSFTSTDGSIAPADRAKLHDFVADVASARFARLEIVPSFQAENWLYCRNKVWGDCFDAARTAENWRFVQTVARIAFAAAGATRLRFDLANEGAPDPSMTPATLAKAKAYLDYVATRFAREFGGGWTISAARSDAAPPGETESRLTLLLADLAAAGLTPKVLELHTYAPAASDVTLSLDEAGAVAGRIGAALVLGELRYHSVAQADAIGEWLRANPRARVADLIQWPEYDPSSVCELDPVPPYTPGPLVNAIGN